MSSKQTIPKIQRLVAKRANATKTTEASVRREIAAACSTPGKPVSVDFVYQWCRNIRQIPARYAIALEGFFGADVYSREEIAPEVFKEAA
ncbi:MAG: helix-turn-helix domain-containing protein [Betaproteobacteria bacterium]|jgi:hypothetical protein|nr:helix-turn-helix domain-containing protein [Betaproteobacteria bacterium]